MGTVSFSDMYGKRAPGREAANNELQPVAAASGNLPSAGKNPAMFWVGMVAMLVLLRFTWEAAKK